MRNSRINYANDAKNMAEALTKIESEKSGEKEKEPRRVFVEVGSGVAPVPSMGSKEFKGNDFYVGIDLDDEALRLGKGFAESVKRGSGENIIFMKADAGDLPFQYHSVDELYFSNVFGSPRIPDFDLAVFLQSARDVLKKEGKPIISETNTPLNFRELKQLLDLAGFSIEKTLKADGPEWPQETEAYSGRSVLTKLPTPGSYLVYAKPAERE